MSRRPIEKGRTLVVGKKIDSNVDNVGNSADHNVDGNVGNSVETSAVAPSSGRKPHADDRAAPEIEEAPDASIAIVDEGDLRGKVHEIRGQKVMLDFELAEIYGYTTKAFNQQVKNNIEKFDEDFRFQLTDDEVSRLSRSKNLTLNKSGRGSNFKYNPYAFTEQGIYMLMTVLRGELATLQSKALIRLFKRLKDYAAEGRGFVGRAEFGELSAKVSANAESIELLREGLQTTDRKVDALIGGMADAVRGSAIGGVAGAFGRFMPKPGDGLPIGAGEPATADLAYSEIYAQAREAVFVVDNYVGLKTLVLLKSVAPGVKVVVFTDNKARLSAVELADFRRQYPDLDVGLRRAGGVFHDRYIMLDFGAPCERLFHCGASSKDAGSRVTTICELEHPAAYRDLFAELLAQPPLEL